MFVRVCVCACVCVRVCVYACVCLFRSVRVGGEGVYTLVPSSATLRVEKILLSLLLPVLFSPWYRSLLSFNAINSSLCCRLCSFPPGIEACFHSTQSSPFFAVACAIFPLVWKLAIVGRKPLFMLCLLEGVNLLCLLEGVNMALTALHLQAGKCFLMHACSLAPC